MQDSIRTQLVVAIRTLDTTPFCIFFFNSELKENKKNLRKKIHLPSLFFVFSLAYFAFIGFWIYICFTKKHSVHRIHLLMAGLLLMKALNLICAAEDKHYVKVTGTPHGWDMLFYIFQFIKVVLLFTRNDFFGWVLAILVPLNSFSLSLKPAHSLSLSLSQTDPQI